ncbi:ribosome maturation factor RimM [Catenulispora yoronensis]|uniref:Ribosome maturation factor RimM n=1 Tax=Catenulispora yoronensis TaxID=450799 RepID=A0ABN2UTB0_9ACTN
MSPETENDPAGRPEALRLVVGRIGRAHGIRGQATIEVRTDDPDLRFARGARLLTEPAERGPLVVTDAKFHNGILLLSFEGVADRDAVEALRNTVLVVEADPDESPQDPEEFYDHQLVGLAVELADGSVLGEIADLLHLPGQDVLAVKRPDGPEVLIPFIKQFVPVVDVAGGRVVADPPAGLLDLDSVE